MRQLICVGCGKKEDLSNPTGDIHTMQLVDLEPLYETPEGPDKPITEDLCSRCRARMRRDFFGEAEGELLEMPLMKGHE